jgi:NADH-quinone oxidoreductase subunit N
MSVFGLMVLVSSANLLTVFLGLELSALPLYVLIALSPDKKKGTEAALKYFILGALASGVLLYGFSLGNDVLSPSIGLSHKLACLQALALYES